MSVNQMQRRRILKVVGLVGIGMHLQAASAISQALPTAPVGAKPIAPAVIEAIVIHPIMKGVVLCAEHSAAQKLGLGDALGSDCLLAQQQEGMGTGAPFALYRRDGKSNEDWLGWHAPLLAPFGGRVESVILNRVTNAVGNMGKSPATMIVFERADGVRVMYARLASIQVKVGQTVRAGEVVGTVGNNGQSRSPHTHVGAWKGRTPLQIRFDLTAPRD